MPLLIENIILFSVFNSSLLVEVEQAGCGRELSNGEYCLQMILWGLVSQE